VVAAVGQTLFVADYDKNRVLRFTGPFDTPNTSYVATGTFTGVSRPVDLAVHPDGSLLVTDQANQRIARYGDAASSASATGPSSAFSDHLSVEPLGVCADRNGRIYIADYRSFRVLIREEAFAATPLSGAGSAEAGALLADLYARPARSSHRVTIGQHLITWLKPDSTAADPGGWYKDWLRLAEAGLPLPKVMGGELVELAAHSTEELIAHGKAGNIVTLTWHAPRPGDADGSKFKQPMSTSDLWALTDDKSKLGGSWKGTLDYAASVLQQFKDYNVPVLFRPMHEQNAPFFWWAHNGAKGAALRDRQAAWLALWCHMVSTLATAKGLDNLLFVFSPNQMSSDWAPPLTYYPGAGWVDVVGMDVYNDALYLGYTTPGLRHYAALIGTGKPFGLAEFGRASNEATGTGTSPWDARTVARRVRDSYPRTVFAVAWNSSVLNGRPENFALADAAFTKELLEDSLIETE
jgi:Glycosyl hydrolase family 26/NHL repeat